MEHHKKYKIIYADPAWVYKDKANAGKRGAEHKYTCTPTEEMGKLLDNLPIDKDAVCLMWVTYPQLEEGLKLMKLWKFEFKTVAFTWVKQNKKSDSFFMGMGRYTRGNPEIVLLGTRGKSVPRVNARIRNLQIHKIGNHSQKPNEIREEIVNLFGDLPRIELFSREKVNGWDCWGNEVESDVQLIATPLNSKGSPSENSLNISLKTTPLAPSKLPTATSLNNNIQSDQRGLLPSV